MRVVHGRYATFPPSDGPGVKSLHAVMYIYVPALPQPLPLYLSLLPLGGDWCLLSVGLLQVACAALWSAGELGAGSVEGGPLQAVDAVVGGI